LVQELSVRKDPRSETPSMDWIEHVVLESICLGRDLSKKSPTGLGKDNLHSSNVQHG